MQMAFRVPITSKQIEHIERFRASRDLELELWFFAEVEAASGRRDARDAVNFKVPQSEWIRVLEECQFKRTLLYEFEAPDPNASGDEDINALVDAAQADLHAGRYDECVAKCRQLIEIAQGTSSTHQRVQSAGDRFCDASSRRNMDRRERILFLWAAMRHVTHMSHHGRPAGFSRDEAKAVLGTVVSLLPTFNESAFIG
ncbi:MAG: hypothetical protein WD382_07480 [Halofilum sp. (in: g-proteobacteria)]